MRFPPKEINSIAELLIELKNQINGFNGPVWYRGQAVSSWCLEPRLMRILHRPPETHYFNRFKQDATFIIQQRPKHEFEWLFLMQHYGVPTRLLDWSESPLVGLYFAVTAEEDKEGTLWVLMPTLLNKKSHYKPDYEFEIPSFEDEHLKNYLPSTIARESKSSLLPMAAIAPRNSSRMQSQQGVFTICHRENIMIEKAGDPCDHAWRFNIPAKSKTVIREELKIMGINRFQLFPELDSLSYNF